ncbi:transmembrane protein 256 homolog [Dendronephthya gigantea]|uniref:transmembrane protein 256 homolog n=1 Tax=Dendronephthya gigantea TaxID=151771 RepID=UPI001069CA86|nr:transmembrane protein 256 homolog [Dendronephthya gigantea]
MDAKGILLQFFENNHRPNMFFTFAGVSGALAIALGAYGSHAKSLNLPENKEFKQSFDSANRYHLLHNVVLLAMPLMKRPTLVGSLFISGQLLFCGSLYTAALTRNKKYGKPAPYGGMLLIAAWISMVF